MKNQAQNQNYFDFTADAACYLNEIKWVQPRNGNAYIAIRASILEGLDGKNKIACDLTIRGQQADEVLQMFADVWPQGYGSRSPKWFAGRLLAIKWLKIDGEEMEIPEWRTESADTENYGEEPYADDAYGAGDYAEHEAHQESPQSRGQSARPQSQPQQRYQGQAQRQLQARQNAPQQRQAQSQQGQQGFRRRNSAA